MSKGFLYVFPFKLSATGEVIDGVVQNVPSFCRKQSCTKKCLDFYKGIDGKRGMHKCPYGFAVAVEEIGGINVTFTCLDIVGVSDKKMVQKRTNDKDFIPRITRLHYDEILHKMKEYFTSMSEYYSHKHQTLLNEDNYQDKIDNLDNTFHELRKLNSRLKAKIEGLIAYLDNHPNYNDAILQKNAKDVFAASQLITIRLSTYDLVLNPNSALNYTKISIPIYKKFDKVARLLDYQAQENDLVIKLSGSSFSTFDANDMVELLPYLLLDNAIKYSKPGRDIEMHFSERGEILEVTVKSFSLRPKDNEIKLLMERNYRSTNVNGKTQGQGLGLFIARYICDANGIGIEINVGSRIETDKMDVKYSDFIVTLQFDGIKK